MPHSRPGWSTQRSSHASRARAGTARTSSAGMRSTRIPGPKHLKQLQIRSLGSLMLLASLLNFCLLPRICRRADSSMGSSRTYAPAKCRTKRFLKHRASYIHVATRDAVRHRLGSLGSRRQAEPGAEPREEAQRGPGLLHGRGACEGIAAQPHQREPVTTTRRSQRRSNQESYQCRSSSQSLLPGCRLGKHHRLPSGC